MRLKALSAESLDPAEFAMRTIAPQANYGNVELVCIKMPCQLNSE